MPDDALPQPPQKRGFDPSQSSPITPGDFFAIELDGGLALYKENANQVYVLNPSAKMMWLELEAGRSPAQAAKAISRAYEAPESVALADVTAALALWKKEGMFDPPQEPGGGAPVEKEPAAEDFTYHSERHYRMLGKKFSVAYSTPFLEMLIHPRLASPMTDPGGGDMRFHIADDKGSYRLFVDGIVTATCVRFEVIGGHFFRQLAMRLHPDRRIAATIHGAAVSRNGRTMLAPAYFGSGKSTLTAAMVKNGYKYFSDDFVPVTMGPPAEALPMPINIGLKQGSWAVLAPYYPELAGLPVNPKFDDRPAKYIRVPEDSIATAPARIDWIIFPAYRPGTRARLISQTHLQALTNLAASHSFNLSGKEGLIRIIEWIKATPSYLLEMDPLPEAMDELEKLWNS